jgi:Rod binding domain-containing protein
MILPADSAAAPAPTSSATAPQRLRKAAESFTAVALGEMLSPMFATLDETGGLLGGGAGEAAFRPMMIQEMAAGIARQGGLGLTDQVAQAMLRLQESKA